MFLVFYIFAVFGVVSLGCSAYFFVVAFYERTKEDIIQETIEVLKRDYGLEKKI